VRLGILGLGRYWQQLRTILKRSKVWSVAAVFDQVHHHATREALHLGARAAESVWQLVSWPGLDALVYCDGQWFGLWPLELAQQLPDPAAASGGGVADTDPQAAAEASSAKQWYRPWLCFVPPIAASGSDWRVLERLADANFPVHFDWPEWHTLPMARLRHRLVRRLGRLVWASADFLGSPDASWTGWPGTAQFSSSQRWRIRWLSGLIALTQLTGSTAEILEVQILGQDQGLTGALLLLKLQMDEYAFTAQIRVLETTGAPATHLSAKGVGDPAIQNAAAWRFRLVGEAGELHIPGPDGVEWQDRRGRILETFRVYRSPLLVSLRHFRRRVQEHGIGGGKPTVEGDWPPASLQQLARYGQRLEQLCSGD